MSKTPTPAAQLAALLEGSGCSQMEAGRLLHVDGRTIRRWLASEREAPWMALELLAILLWHRKHGTEPKRLS